MFREEYIIVQIVNRPFISTLSEIQIRLLFTRSECRYLNVAGHCQQFILTTRPVVLMVLEQRCLSMYQILPENILLTSTLSTIGDQVLLSPKNASKVIFNAREVLRCTDTAKPDILVLLMFMFHLPL